MGKQTFYRLKRTSAILLLVIFVLSLTAASVSALYKDTNGATCEVYKKTGNYPYDVRCCTVPGTNLVECCDINYAASSPETRYINCETTDVSKAGTIKTGIRKGTVVGGVIVKKA